MIDLIATGGYAHTVLVNGSKWSGPHSQPHKAHESAYDAGVQALRHIAEGTLDEFPEIRVISRNEIRAEVDPNQDLAEIPAASDPPTSDGGLDLIDFINAVDPFDPDNVEIIEAGPLTERDARIYAGMRELAERSKQGTFAEDPRNFLLKPYVARVGEDGEPVRIGWAWRGYKLMVDQRDTTAIRIGVGGGGG